MARRADASLAAILLTQRLVDAPAEAFKAREYWALSSVVPDLGGLLGQSVGDLSSELDPALATRLVGRFEAATSLAFELEKLDQQGIQVLASVDSFYPARFLDCLGPGAPAVLYVAGPIEILDGPGLGIVGSHDVSSEGAEVARDAARRAVETGWNVVSGASPGVDRFALEATLAVDGCYGALLAESLLRVTREPELRAAIGQGRLCLATPYPPAASYTVTNAQGRNKLIYAASEITLVVAADRDQDTTVAGATEAIEQDRDVAVWTGPGAGPSNEALVALGARPITDLDQIWD
jgi:predicted Rossmann fold nucleotide-binding protein DprA/Smf involved in DNA uptake